MTDNEIIKALECCFDGYCEACAFDDDLNLKCKDNLIENALNLINRQKAEIERLQEQIGSLNKKYPCTVDVGDNCLVYARSLDDYDNLIGNISAEGIKEFWKKYRDTLVSNHQTYICLISKTQKNIGYLYDDIMSNGDNLVKEMTEQSVNYESSKTESK